MQFYYNGQDGISRKLTIEEVREHLSPGQIVEAIDAKLADPAEEVSYMTVGGFITVEFK